MRLPWHRGRPDTPTAAHPPAAVDAGPATRGPEDDPPADDLDQQRRNTAAVAAYGRLLTGARTPQDPTADPTGDVHVCGIGLIPIAVALAAVPVDDARHRLRLDPDDQAARDDEQQALAHLREITHPAGAAARARGDEGLAPPR
jgi:hypothetical protein